MKRCNSEVFSKTDVENGVYVGLLRALLESKTPYDVHAVRDADGGLRIEWIGKDDSLMAARFEFLSENDFIIGLCDMPARSEPIDKLEGLR